MEMRLQRRDNVDGIERIDVSGHVTRNGWRDEDPLVRTYGADVYSQRVMLNLTRVDYVDSLGVEWLLSSHRRFEAAGGQLYLHSFGEACQQLLNLMRMDMVLNMAPDERTAHERICEMHSENGPPAPDAAGPIQEPEQSTQ